MNTTLSSEIASLRKDLLPSTYEQVEEYKKKIIALQETVNRELEEVIKNNNEEEIAMLKNRKDAVDGLLVIVEPMLKEIEHQIWVRSRDANEEDAEMLVPEIPDQIIRTLSTALQHDGKPRKLLKTKAFQERLKRIGEK